MSLSESVEASNSQEPESAHTPGGYRELAHFAIPLVISTSSITIMQVLDRLFLTWYSTDAMAACLPASMTHFTLLSIPFGLISFSGTFVSQYEGARLPERSVHSAWQAIFLAVFFGFLISAVSPWSVEIFRLVGHVEPVLGYESTYFRWMSLGSIPMLLVHALSSYFTGLGRTKVILLANVIGALSNVFIDYLLIFGLNLPEYGISIPSMGVTGAAIGTIMGEVVMLFVMLCYVEDKQGKHRFWEGLKFDRGLLNRMLYFGLPAGFHVFADVCTFSIFILLVGSIDKASLTATNLAFNLNTLAFFPMIGLAQAVSTLVGRRIGEGRPSIAEASARSGVILAIVYMLIWGLLYCTLPEYALKLYESPENVEDFPAVREIVIWLLRFVAIYCCFDAMAITFGAALRGAGDTTFPLFFMFCSGWLVLVFPTWLVLYFGGEWVLFNSWLVCTIYIMVLGIGFWLRFEYGPWRKTKVIEEPVLIEQVPNEIAAEPTPTLS